MLPAVNTAEVRKNLHARCCISKKIWLRFSIIAFIQRPFLTKLIKTKFPGLSY